MIPTIELIHAFELGLNKIDRQDNIEVSRPKIITYLNMAQISWIKNKINPNNPLRAGYETIRKRIDDLQILKSEPLRLTPRKTQDHYHSFSCDLKDVSDYMFYNTSHSIAKKGSCESRIQNNLIREGELDTQYYDKLYGPSFEWRETLTTLGNDKIFVYTDGTFEVLSVYITYLRYPKLVDIVGYEKFNGSSSVDQDCELPYYALQDIADLAIKFAAHATDNFPQAQAADDRIIKNGE